MSIDKEFDLIVLGAGTGGNGVCADGGASRLECCKR